MKEDCAHIVQMAIQCEKTSPRLIRPDFDFIVVPARDKERLCFVKVDPSDRAVMFFESINEGTHSIVPQLNGGGVKGDEDPWPRMLSVSKYELGNILNGMLTVWDGMRYPLLEKIWTQTTEQSA